MRSWRLALFFLLMGCAPTPSFVEVSLENFYQVEQSVPFIPEYDEVLERILIFATNADERELATIANVEHAIPPSTKVIIAHRSGTVKARLDRLFGLPERVSYLNIQSTSFTSWAQDYAKGAGNSLLLPFTYSGQRKYDPAVPGNKVVEALAKLLRVTLIHSPLEFAGGNLLLARNSLGQKYVLVGADAYRESVDRYQQLGETLDEPTFKEILHLSFNADDVLILGRRNADGSWKPQNKILYHLDQIILPIEDGIVTTLEARTWPRQIDLAPYKKLTSLELEQREFARRALWERAQSGQEHLEDLRVELAAISNQLHANGFQTVAIPSSLPRLMQSQSPLNGVLYFDALHDRRTFLYPHFPLLASIDTATDQIAIERLESLGVRVLPVAEEGFFERGGNLHCIVLRGLSRNFRLERKTVTAAGESMQQAEEASIGGATQSS